MNTLHLIADWLSELDIPPEKANCVWLIGFPEITFDRKNLTLPQYTKLILRGNSTFKQTEHNPENLVGYHPLPVNSIMVRVNNCLERDQVSPHRVLYTDSTGIWENPTRIDIMDQNMLRED
jgi:hypothetical protein